MIEIKLWGLILVIVLTFIVSMIITTWCFTHLLKDIEITINDKSQETNND